jgi:hypothetical protein
MVASTSPLMIHCPGEFTAGGARARANGMEGCHTVFVPTQPGDQSESVIRRRISLYILLLATFPKFSPSLTQIIMLTTYLFIDIGFLRAPKFESNLNPCLI